MNCSISIEIFGIYMICFFENFRVMRSHHQLQETSQFLPSYSNDEQQIRELLAAEIADNVKKGWEEIV